jgi:tetratricopeptide (TPR) repeat protein
MNLSDEVRGIPKAAARAISQKREQAMKSLWGVLSVVVLVLAGAADAADQVTRRSDRVVLRGELTELSTTALKMKLQNGQDAEIPVSEVLAIRFDMEPPTLVQAQSNERSGALATALEKYKQIQGEYSGDDKRVVTELKFLIARTQVRMAQANPADFAAAEKAIGTFRSESRTNFRYLEATLLEAELLAGDAARADAAKKLLEEVQGTSVKGFRLQAGVQLGLLLLSGKDTEGAQAAFEKVVQESAGDALAASAMFDGQLGKALCQKTAGKPDEALATLADVFTKASESETKTLARAWLLKGDCFREKGLPKDALMAYLHVDVLYSSEPGPHAESLYHLATLWGPAGYQNRADDARARLTNSYPNSRWAKQ